MKNGIKNWFKNKKAPLGGEEVSSGQESYKAVSSNSLYSLPVEELVAIIFKFDIEVKNLNKDLEAAKEHVGVDRMSEEQSALYRQQNETLQIECNKLAIELNEVNSMLRSKQIQLDAYLKQLASNEELIKLYKLQIKDLEKQVFDLQINGIKFDTDDEMKKLRVAAEENKKNLAELNDYKNKYKILEQEIVKLNVRVKADKEQIKILREKVNSIDDARKVTEIEMGQKAKELEGMRNEANKLKVLKDTIETECKSVKASLKQNMLKLTKKLDKITVLKNTNLELQQQCIALKYELDMNIKSSQETTEKLLSETEQLSLSHKKELLFFQESVSSLEAIKEKNQFLEANYKNMENLYKLIKLTAEETSAELGEKSLKISDLEDSLTKLTDLNSGLMQKQQSSEEEILKLTRRLQQLETFPPVPAQELKNHSIPETQREADLLSTVKTELESLYKFLMKIISADKDKVYLIKQEDFTNFEKRLNNIVMILYEQLEEFSQQRYTKALINPSSKNTKGRTPIKLFSCIADQDEAPRVIPKPQKPATDNKSITMIRRGSAN